MDQLVQIDVILARHMGHADAQTRRLSDTCVRVAQQYKEQPEALFQKLSEVLSQTPGVAQSIVEEVLSVLKSDGMGVRARALSRMQPKASGEPKAKRPFKLSLNLAFTPRLSLQLNSELPLSRYEKQLMTAIGNNKVTIVSASTGSGKSTQIGQLLLKYCMSPRLSVVITQPRRLPCLQLCQRVQAELQKQFSCAGITGYKVRFDQQITEETRLVFETDGFLVQELQHTFLAQLNAIDYLVIDEAHESSVQTEILLALLRSNLSQLKTKIIIMSATLELDQFKEYFADASIGVVEVPGRLFPIARKFATEPLVQMEERLAEVSRHCCQYISMKLGLESPFPTEYSGTLLAFLPGAEEIARVHADIETFLQIQSLDDSNITILELHSRLSSTEQRRVFLTYPSSQAVIVLATNIAETSLTIPRCTCVVDSGLVRFLEYNPQQHCNALKTADIDKASMAQRAGRAGRVAPGLYLACFAENQITLERNKAEISRVELSQVVLQMVKLHGGAISESQIAAFRFLHYVSPQALNQGLAKLQKYGLTSLLNATHTITRLGRQVANSPVDIHMAIALSAARKSGAVHTVAKVAAFISTGIPVQNLLENIQNDFLQICHLVDLCLVQKAPGIALQQQQFIQSAYKQLLNGAQTKRAEDSPRELLESLAPGFRENIAEYDEEDRCYYIVKDLRPRQHKPRKTIKLTQMQPEPSATLEKQLLIHPSSSLYHRKPKYVLFASLIETRQKYMSHCMEVSLDAIRGALNMWQIQQE